MMTGSQRPLGRAMERYLPDTPVVVVVAAAEAEEGTRLWAVPTGEAGIVPVGLDRST